MAYELRNGKVYEVKEVNVNEIEKEVKQTVEFIKQHTEAQKPYLSAVAAKKNELAQLTERYNKEIASFQLVINEHNAKIDEAKAKLADKKEIIAKLYPNYKSYLGF